MSILHAVQKWCPYLLGNHFYINTHHQSLKYFLEQWVSSPTPQKSVRKIMGYDYEITYKKATDNILVDVLFCTFDAHVFLSIISMPFPTWLHFVQKGYVNDSSLSEIIQQLASNPYVVLHYSWVGSYLRYKGRMVIPQSTNLKHVVFYEIHASPSSISMPIQNQLQFVQ